MSCSTLVLTVLFFCHYSTATPLPPFRPPAVPLIVQRPYMQVWMESEKFTTDITHYWTGHPMEMSCLVMIDGVGYSLIGTHGNGLTQIGLEVRAANTIASYTTPLKNINLNITFLTPKLPTLALQDLVSQPSVTYVTLEWSANDQKPHTVSWYLDLSAQHAVNLMSAEFVTWETVSGHNTKGVRIGTAAQTAFNVWGDSTNANWGYHYLASGNSQTLNVTGGYANTVRQSFLTGGRLPPMDTRKPRSATDNMPVVAITNSCEASTPCTFLVGYDDDERTLYYYGSVLPSFYSTKFSTFDRALDWSWKNYESLRFAARQFDSDLIKNATALLGLPYAQMVSLAMRQVMAAIDFVSSPTDSSVPWAFLKEISSGGDINTMDVIYPACPMLLYYQPKILELLLTPVLYFANNETWIPFTDPYSPHQLGYYPMANATTSDQEVMPLENSGNMMYMLTAILQRSQMKDVSWFYPKYWKVLTGFAEYMMNTQLPDPPKQLCTDDFAGPLAHNANLAAKGMIALYAYSWMCTQLNESNCDVYKTKALQYASDWMTLAWDPTLGYSKLAYDQPNTWSTKYNMLWQKILHLDGPFVNYTQIMAGETAQYMKVKNQYGIPMDIRHTYAKLDWMVWGSLVEPTGTSTQQIISDLVNMLNTTVSRWAMTDLFDTVTGNIALMFRARPVVGAVFAPLLMQMEGGF